jgi:hypothetical protein
VNRQRSVEQRRCCRADQGSEAARRNFRRCADRSARASHQLAARIVTARDEAEALGSSGELWRGVGRDPDDEQRAPRRRAQTARVGAFGGFGQAFECIPIGVAEGQTDAERDAVAQWMRADGIRDGAWR